MSFRTNRPAARPYSDVRRRFAFLLLGIACAALLWRENAAATDFPGGEPVRVVDAALVARLRAAPGLHLPLAADYRLEAALDLRDDPANRAWYGTDLDLREAVGRRAIHIQRKDGRLAIHADGANPRAGALLALEHGTVDVPVIPLALGALVGLVGAARRSRRAERTMRTL